jgi:hypothetical protein
LRFDFLQLFVIIIENFKASIMKTSMAYRLYRLYFNSNAHNHELFGNRVHNPMNATAINRKEANIAALTRFGLIVAAAVTLITFIAVN